MARTLLLLILSFVFHINIFGIFQGDDASRPISMPDAGVPDKTKDATEAPEVKFVSFVLDDVQKTWTRILPAQAGINYHHAILVLYRDATSAGCGLAQSATGPFYCPEDEKVYLDLGFFAELKSRFGARQREFAQAYVIAHELGHHVQKLAGTMEKGWRRPSDKTAATPTNTRSTPRLQADCYAGI